MAFKDVEEFEIEEGESPEAAAARYMKDLGKPGYEDGDGEEGEDGGGDDDEGNEGEGDGDNGEEGEDGGSDGEQQSSDSGDKDKSEEDGEDLDDGDDDSKQELSMEDNYFSQVAEDLGVKLDDAPVKGFLPIKRKGKIDWLSPKDYAAMAMKGTDYTKKTMALATIKKDMKKFENINDSDVEALALIKSGDFKKGLAMLSNSNNKSIDEIYDAATEIDEEYLSTVKPTQATERQSFSPEVSEYFNTIPETEKNVVVDISKRGLFPPSFEAELMSNKKIMSSVVDDIHSGRGEAVIEECHNKMDLMDEYEFNKVLNNPSEYINLYVKVFSEMYSNGSDSGANKPTQDNAKDTKGSKKGVDRKTVKKKNSQNFGKQHKKGNGSIRDEVLSDIESANKMAEDPEYLAKVAKEKYGVEIQK